MYCPVALAPKWKSTLCPTEVICAHTRGQEGWFWTWGEGIFSSQEPSWVILPTYYRCLIHSPPTKTRYSDDRNQNHTRQFKLLIPKHLQNLSEFPGIGEPRTRYLVEFQYLGPAGATKREAAPRCPCDVWAPQGSSLSETLWKLHRLLSALKFTFLLRQFNFRTRGK